MATRPLKVCGEDFRGRKESFSKGFIERRVVRILLKNRDPRGATLAHRELVLEFASHRSQRYIEIPDSFHPGNLPIVMRKRRFWSLKTVRALRVCVRRPNLSPKAKQSIQSIPLGHAERLPDAFELFFGLGQGRFLAPQQERLQGPL